MSETVKTCSDCGDTFLGNEVAPLCDNCLDDLIEEEYNDNTCQDCGSNYLQDCLEWCKE